MVNHCFEYRCRIHRLTHEVEDVNEVFLLFEGQMELIRPFFPPAHGVPRVDDRRILSGVIYVIRDRLQWKDAAKAYGPHRTLYNRFVRWSRSDVSHRIFVALTEQAGRSKRLVIDATHRKAYRTAASLLKKSFSSPCQTHERQRELRALCYLRRSGATGPTVSDCKAGQ